MRRTLLALVMVLATLPGAPSAGADGAFSDPAGDVALDPAGAALPANPQTGAADLVALDVLEGEHDWTFILSVASLQQSGGTIGSYDIMFTWDDANYRVDIFRSRVDPTSDPLLGAELQLADGERFNKVIDLDVVEDTAAGTFTVQFEKLYVASLEGHAPVTGSELTDVFATTRSNFDFGGAVPLGLSDRMPDDGAGTIPYLKAGEATGHIVLEPLDPIRISNGGSGTFVYTVHVQNRGEVDDDVQMSVADVPKGWTAKVHPQYKVPAKDERPMLIVVTLPFEHVHGGFSSFTLQATSTRDPSAKASVKLGVVHTPVPQPAGHHNELFLHAVPEDSGLFQTIVPRTTNTMNTLEEHGDDLVEALGPPGGNGELVWDLPLGPQLAMGVDFDTLLTGTLEGAILAHMVGDGEVSAELWMIQGDEDVALLADAPPMPVTLDLAAPSAFSLVLTPTPESDYIPYAPGQNLELRLRLATTAPCCDPHQPPGIPVDSFRMTLPLREYHEAIALNEEDEAPVARVTLDLEGAPEKLARPGTTVTYAFAVTNTAETKDDYTVEIEGTGKDAATVAPTRSFSLEPGASTRLVLGVKVPTSSNDGEILEALLVVRSASDPANVAIGRTSTVVTHEGDAVADESEILANANGQDKSMPAPPGALLALALLCLAVMRKKERD